MDIADLKAAIAGLEDGLQVFVGFDEDTPVQVIEGRYESCVTYKRGFLLIADEADWGSLRNKITDLEGELEDAHTEIATLLKKLSKELTP